MRRLIVLLTLAFCLSVPALAPAAAGAGEYVGKVNHVMSDSTLRMNYKGGQIRVRLQSVEAVEWPDLKQALEERLVGREVRVEGIRWQEGYLLGRVYLEGKHVGRELLADE